MKVIIKKVANVYGVLSDNGEIFLKGFNTLKKSENYCKRNELTIESVEGVKNEKILY